MITLGERARTLYSPFAGAVDAECGDTALTTDGGDLLDDTSRWLLLTHDFHGLLGDGHQAEEVDFHLCACLLLCDFLKNTRETIAGIVDHDINALESIYCLLECGFDILLLGDVELNSEIVLHLLEVTSDRNWGGYLVCGVLEAQSVRLSRSCNCNISTINNFLDEVISEPSRSSGDEEDSRHVE